jgi:hypothetical protein
MAISEFEQLSQAIPTAESLAPIVAQDTAFADEELSDKTALGIVLQDVDTAEKYLQSKNIISNLDNADQLYAGYVKPRVWANGKNRSSLSMPIVLEAIEKILPTLYMSLFGNGKDPFYLRPVGRTKPEAARAKSKILSWAIKQSDLKEGMRLALKNCLQYGFCVGNYGWTEREQIVKKYVTGEDGTVKVVKEVVTFNVPTFETMDLRQILWDPACKVQNLRDRNQGAKYVVKQVFVDANWLDENRDNPLYKNIPTREELRDILAHNMAQATNSLKASQSNQWNELQAEQADKPTSADPLSAPLELLEYWSEDRVIVVLQRVIVIRNEESEFSSLPFPSCAFIDVLNSAIGFGIAKLLAGEQRFQVGVLNTWVDSLSLSLNPVFQIIKGLGAGTQQVTLSPGKVLTETAELKPLITPSVSGEAQNAIGASEQRAAKRIGSQGGADMPTQALRTAQGIQSYQGNATERLQYLLEIFISMVFVPTLEAFLEMSCDHLTKEQIQQILTDAEGKVYEGDILEVYNASVEVEVLAGTKLASRQAAAQLVPVLAQLVAQEPFQDSLAAQGKKFDYAELLDEAIELSGWDLDSLIVDMTPEDVQRQKEQNAALIKAQASQQQQQTDHENKLAEINEKGTVQAGVAVVRSLVKSHADEAQGVLDRLGNPGGQQ